MCYYKENNNRDSDFLDLMIALNIHRTLPYTLDINFVFLRQINYFLTSSYASIAVLEIAFFQTSSSLLNFSYILLKKMSTKSWKNGIVYPIVCIRQSYS